jgi:hypothetical protein
MLQIGMASKKNLPTKRISLSADSQLQRALIAVAERDNMLVTTKAMELLRIALELEEDIALAEVADTRMQSSARSRFVDHTTAWQNP